MDLADSETRVGQVEESPERVPLYYGDLEAMIATLMEDLYQLSLTGADNDRKMWIVAVEYPDRLVPERHREANAIEARP